MSKTDKNAPENAATAKPSQKRKGGRNRGALAAIGGLLVASAIVRLSIGATEAMAQADDATVIPAVAEKTDEGADELCVMDEDIIPLVEALNEREAAVRARELELSLRADVLRVSEEQARLKLAELEQAENDLRATIAVVSTAAEDDLTRLTDVYASMKPKQAAALFETMDPEFAAGFLGRMRPDAAAQIMAGLSPTAAYSVSVILAGRNANAPKE